MARGRRANHEGTIYQRKDGYWVVQIPVGGRRRTWYAKSREEAQRKLNELRIEQYLGTLPPPSGYTLAEWVEEWFRLIEPDLRPTTLHKYRMCLRHVVRIAGETKLHRLTPVQLQEVFVRLHREGVGARTRQLAWSYLNTCLNRAVQLRVLSHNPLQGVAKPDWEPGARVYWDLDQLRRFIDTGLVHPGRWSPLFVLLATTGMRISEALGLTWEDIDLERGAVTIRRAVVWTSDSKTSYVLAPKSRAGYRTVTLPAAGLAALLRLEPGAPGARVFVTATGRTPTPTNLSAPLRRLCRDAGVPAVNIHGLRHIHVMAALRATRDPHLVQRRVGHSDVHTTLSIYGYSPDDDDAAARALDQLLG